MQIIITQEGSTRLRWTIDPRPNEVIVHDSTRPTHHIGGDGRLTTKRIGQSGRITIRNMR